MFKKKSSQKEMSECVFEYPEIKEILKKEPNQKERIKKYLLEIAADYKTSSIMLIKKSLDIVLEKIYDEINLNVPEGMDFKKLCEENNVVMVPNHQSHADYLAINWMTLKKFDIPLYIAGGINLNIFPIGKFFRNCGCFFIRRTFNDDKIYKATLEGYLYFLLLNGKTIEFFFEGGRSRTGKLLPPKYGLYQMILEAHSHIPAAKKKKLLFQPVSVIHEYVPEHAAMVREMMGEPKKKENIFQLFKVFKLVSKQFGSIHLNLGTPIEGFDTLKLNEKEQRKATYNLAFRLFNQVGQKMAVTPTSLLALILLEEPSGSLKWNTILNKARIILSYCEKFEVPYIESLKEEKFVATMERAMDILIGNEKVEVLGLEGSGAVFYTVKKECRMELLYFKNTILHQFLVPWTINSAWINIFNGTITDEESFKKYLISARDQLKHEFYLPTTLAFLQKSLNVISICVGRPINSLAECLELTYLEFFRILKEIGVFSHAGNYIHEAYYICALAIKALKKRKKALTYENVLKRSKKIFKEQLEIEVCVRYPESLSVPLLKSSLGFFEAEGYIKLEGNKFILNKEKSIDDLIATFERFLEDSWTININPIK
jgi:glycerol-3-phosphate O-acyltransferase